MPEVAPRSAPSVSESPSPSSDRGRVDSLLAGFLAGARRRASAPLVRPLFDRTAAFLLAGGKRVRPRLVLASYRILADQAEPPRPVWLAASSLELFHGFMLVHDDLIDGSLVRRGRPTLHESLRIDGEAIGLGPDRGLGLGLVAGDLLCALGMRMIARSGLDDASLARAHRLVSDMLFETGLGEALDILYEGAPLDCLGEPQLIETYLGKTARYTVSCPLVLGASLAGAPARSIKALGRFGDLLGLGYQIQNDLDAIRPDADSENPDLDSGKRTILLWEAYRGLSRSGRSSLAEALDAPPGPLRRRRMLGLFEDSGAFDRCRDRLASLRREAGEVLRASGLDPERRRAFVALASILPKGDPADPGLAARDQEILAS